ncbi:hypothetical protein D3C72_2314410 [compost metagenome]
MDGDAGDGDLDAVGGKGLVFDMAGGFAVDGVAELGAELFQVDLVCAAADFFVGREENADGAVPDIVIVHQELRR